jgi:thiol-disulfide isomerase/thioredoxin
MAEATILHAMRLRDGFADLAAHYKSATRLTDEVIHDTGFDLPCYVVRVTATDQKGPNPSENPTTDTFWIDQKTLIVQKSAHHEDTFTNEGAVQIPTTIETFTRYSTVQLSPPIPNSLFHFHPPSDAQLVAQFNIHHRVGFDMTGRAAPDVQLIAADGATVPLSSYRGKPVLLDFWATWCHPCIENFPRLKELQKETAPMGLVLLGVDEDEEEKKATYFLAQHNYVWPNTHDDSSTIHQTFDSLGLPHVVLIDAQGIIAFSGSGEDEYGLRTAIAALGPTYASLAPLPKLQDACKTASKQPPIN